MSEKNTVASLMAQAKEKSEAKKAGGIRPIKPSQGNHTYRILPSWRGLDADGGSNPFWHDFGQHFIRPAAGSKVESVYVCSHKTFEEECEVCNAINQSMRLDGVSDSDLKTLKDARASQHYLINVLHRSGPADKVNEPQLMVVGSKIFEQIADIVGMYNDITDLATGRDIAITRKGTGFDTTYNVVPTAAPSVVDVSIMANAINIDAVVDQRSPVGEARALTTVAKIVGIEVAERPAIASTSVAGSLGTDAAEAEYVDDSPVVVEAELDSEEDLLAGLDKELDSL